MKRSHSDNNLEDESIHSGDGNNLSTGSGSQTGGSYNNNRGGLKRTRNEENIRLLIPSRFAGGIIGKGGQNIKRLRQEFNTHINVEDCPGPERTVNIAGPELNNALKVVEDLLRNFGENDNEIDLRLLIHQSLAGCVIGKGGGKIKEIRDKVGCRILKVFSNMCPQSTDRVVQCIGKVEECMEAINDILLLVKEVPIKGPVQNYDPINYDDYLADKYGGFGGENGGNGGNRANAGGNRGGDNRGFAGRNNNNNNGRGERGGSFDRRDNNNRNFNNNNRGGGGGRNDRNGGSRGNNNNNMRDRERNNFINPWASSQTALGGGGGNNNFDGSSFNNNGFGTSGGFGASNQFGNNGLGLGFNNPNSLMSNNSLGSGLNSSFGNNSSMNSNTGFDNNMGANNGPIFGMNSLGGNNLANNMGNNGQSGDEPKETTQVTIPKDLAGAIIGKAGTRIRRIRMESNAFITIDEPAQGSTDRIITISGTQRQIQLAQYLLQQSVREHRRN